MGRSAADIFKFWMTSAEAELEKTTEFHASLQNSLRDEAVDLSAFQSGLLKARGHVTMFKFAGELRTRTPAGGFQEIAGGTDLEKDMHALETFYLRYEKSLVKCVDPAIYANGLEISTKEQCEEIQRFFEKGIALVNQVLKSYDEVAAGR
jgi:hypothetical protein